MPEIGVKGTQQLRLLGQTLLRQEVIGKKEVRGALREGVKPGIAAARANARSTLPQHGGLARKVGASRINTVIRETGRQIGIRITTRTFDKRLDTVGEARHPVFGHRDRWAVTKVRPHWFSDPMKEVAPEMRQELLAIMRVQIARLRSKVK